VDGLGLAEVEVDHIVDQLAENELLVQLDHMHGHPNLLECKNLVDKLRIDIGRINVEI